MCIAVERAHFEQLIRDIREKISILRRSAPERGSEFLLSLEPSYAEAAIVFRDFPKAHGNIIQKAVGMALAGHVGGLSKTEVRFSFLSGVTVSVDNFFLSARGKIYLFETKRDIANVRDALRVEATRNLKAVAAGIELFVWATTGRTLRHPIECAFFSYVDEEAPRPIRLNVGSPAAPSYVNMPVYGRTEMNALIGDCFGMFLDCFDDFLGQEVGQNIPGVRLRDEKQLDANPLRRGVLGSTDEDSIVFGSAGCESPSEDDVLS